MIVFPFFVGVFLSAFDVAMMNIRAVMLERATDTVVRAIRLSSGADLDYDVVMADVCNAAGLIPDCMNTLRIELVRLNGSNWNGLQHRPDCVARNNPIKPLVKFKNGQQNEMMLIRICAVVDPIFPGIGVGRTMPKDASGGYQVIATSAFVNEPQ
ncbi:MAG: pilus assembly protein [Silicimonas sp.]|nr:pilus assembly protein [Silicimonas sp.]